MEHICPKCKTLYAEEQICDWCPEDVKTERVEMMPAKLLNELRDAIQGCLWILEDRELSRAQQHHVKYCRDVIRRTGDHLNKLIW